MPVAASAWNEVKVWRVALAATVIPAKCGIPPLARLFSKLGGVNSRFQRNGRRLEEYPLPHHTTAKERFFLTAKNPLRYKEVYLCIECINILLAGMWGLEGVGRCDKI